MLYYSKHLWRWNGKIPRNISINKTDTKEVEALNRPITIEEIWVVVKNLHQWKALGQDRFMRKLHQCFKDHIIPMLLLNMYKCENLLICSMKPARSCYLFNWIAPKENRTRISRTNLCQCRQKPAGGQSLWSYCVSTRLTNSGANYPSSPDCIFKEVCIVNSLGR